MDRTQQIILGIAGVFVFFQSFRGWRMGPFRQLFRFGALAAAYGVSLFVAPSVVPLLRSLHYPDFLLQYAAGILLAFLAYFLVNFIGGLFFKRTSDQSFGLVWFLCGVTGSLLGMAFGLVLVVGVAIAIRFMGVLVEGSGSTAPVAAQAASHQPMRPPQNPRPIPPLASAVLEVKRSLEAGPTGIVLQAVDPVPKECYETIGKVGQLVSRPEAVNRFLDYPGAKELIDSPEIAALKQDPEVAREIAAHHYLELLKNERFVKTCNNPKLARALKNFDVNKALDFALKQ